jgi:hypothetical protein
MDFIVNGLAIRRIISILSVVDAFTRECLVLEADTSLRSDRPPRELDRLIKLRGHPHTAREIDGERKRRKFHWTSSRRPSERELVPHIQGCATDPRQPCQEFICERRQSSLAYRTLAELRSALSYEDTESKHRFSHPHGLDYDGGEIYRPHT